MLSNILQDRERVLDINSLTGSNGGRKCLKDSDNIFTSICVQASTFYDFIFKICAATKRKVVLSESYRVAPMNFKVEKK